MFKLRIYIELPYTYITKEQAEAVAIEALKDTFGEDDINILLEPKIVTLEDDGEAFTGLLDKDYPKSNIVRSMARNEAINRKENDDNKLSFKQLCLKCDSIVELDHEIINLGKITDK